ncbi:hypothetical protein [Micromonospora sp. NBRC 101691]|nr:hypothetical protein [Micromonospora sp. NBRC 101691]
MAPGDPWTSDRTSRRTFGRGLLAATAATVAGPAFAAGSARAGRPAVARP